MPQCFVDKEEVSLAARFRVAYQVSVVACGGLGLDLALDLDLEDL